MIAFAIENEVDGFGGLRTNERMVEVGSGTQSQIGQTIQRVPRAFRVDRRECSTVPGVHGLQQVVAAFVADLAHNDPVGAMAERRSYKLARSDSDLAGNRLYCFPANGVGMGDLQLSWLLDHDEAFVKGNMVEQCFHQSRFARSRPAADQTVLTIPDEADNGIAS